MLDDFIVKEDRNYKGKCFYLLTAIKKKDKSQYLELNQEFKQIVTDETYEFYQKLLGIYEELPALKADKQS